MDQVMASRKIIDLCPELQEKAIKFRSLMNEAGIDFIFTCTTRSPKEQDELYAQGRTKPGRKVTWTKKSKHVGGRAFDIVIMDRGKCVWDVTDPRWEQAGEIGQSLGLVWGGSWQVTKDFPHFELKEEGNGK